MSWPKHEHHIVIVFFGKSAEVRVGKIDARPTAPVAEEAAFDVVKTDRTFHEVIIC